MLDKIVKNDKIMGVVTLVTLALVVVLFVKSRNAQETTTTDAPTVTE